MTHDYAQRRRVAVAVAVTVIAVPSAFLLDRGAETEPAGATATLAGTQPAAPDPAGSTDGAAATDADVLGTAPIGYLTGTTVPNDDDPATIAIPVVADSIRGAASFSSDIDSIKRCIAKGVPFNATLTVTNLDNSQSVRCVASITGIEPTTDVVLQTDAFLQIADLTDAPVPVQITWTTE